MKAELSSQKQDTKNTLCGVIRCGVDVVETEPDGNANKAAREINLDRRFQTQRHSGMGDIKTLSSEFTQLVSGNRHNNRLETLLLIDSQCLKDKRYKKSVKTEGNALAKERIQNSMATIE